MDPNLLNCPQCNHKFNGEIYLCESGHGICELCNLFTSSCPECKAKMTDKRNFGLEAIIKEVKDKAKIACEYKGCSYKLTGNNYDVHKMECKFRIHKCQIAIFSGIPCDWSGSYEELLKHFRGKHQENAKLSTNVKALYLQFDFEDYKDTQILSYLDAKQLFYYKCKVDKNKEMVYFLFQFVGTNKEAANYTYEFEINKGFRKFKVSGLCVSDVEDFDKIFEEQDCICISFQHLRQYLDDKNETSARFRIGNISYYQKDNKAPTSNEETQARTSENPTMKAVPKEQEQKKKSKAKK